MRDLGGENQLSHARILPGCGAAFQFPAGSPRLFALDQSCDSLAGRTARTRASRSLDGRAIFAAHAGHCLLIGGVKP
jgi:hypothetical protein